MGRRSGITPVSTPSHDLLDELPLDEGQPFAAAQVREGQLLLVEPELVQDRGVDVSDVVWLLDRTQPDRVRRPDRLPAPHPAASEPHREPEIVVAAARPAPGPRRTARPPAPAPERAI